MTEGLNLPPIPEGMTVEQYVEQGFGYPPWAHQDESNAAETGRDDGADAAGPAEPGQVPGGL